MESDVNPKDIALEDIHLETCTTKECVDDSDLHKLQCTTCKRRVHYKCTMLPLYQLQRYLTFGNNYCKYICVTCIEVPDDLRTILPKGMENEILIEEIEKQKDLIKVYENELSSLRTAVKTMENEITNNITKKRKRNSTGDSTSEIEDLIKENQDLIQESANLKSLLNDKETITNVPKTNPNDSECNQTKAEVNIIKELNQIISDRFEKIEANLTTMIDKKLEDTKGNLNTGSEQRTYAAATGKTNGTFSTKQKEAIAML
jgi:hypothetical protein